MGQGLTVDSQTRKGLDTYEASPLPRATHGAAVVMEDWVPPPPRSPKPLSTPLTQSEQPPKPEVDTTRNMDQWALRTPGHLRQLLRS